MFTLLADRHVFAPWGLFGGLSGRKSNFYVERDGELSEVPSKTTFRVREGEVVWVESPGGGGWGDPADRDPDAIARDVAMGMVSPGVLTSPSDARRSS
jgi:N-methylhydantoinase B